MKNRQIRVLLAAGIGILLMACTKSEFQLEGAMDPPAILRHIWNDYQENYGLFEVKQIDWDSVYKQHAEIVDAQSSPAELYREVTRMLASLNDRHVTLYPSSNPELPRWSIDLDSAGTYQVNEYNWAVVRDHYLTDYQAPSEVVQYARLAGNIGYIHLTDFDAPRKVYEKGLDMAFAALAESTALILDIRDNSGGYDPTSQYVAGRFATAAATYMTSRKKSGPGPDDFAETREWQVVPTGKRQFTKPILVLTTWSTASAAETFLLAMRTQAHVRQMGSITAGNFSDSPMWEAPNGWAYTISVGDYRAADGKSYEGIGLAPDIHLESRREDWVNQQDVVLEKAIELLQ